MPFRGIRTGNPRKQAAADTRPRARGQYDRLPFISNSINYTYNLLQIISICYRLAVNTDPLYCYKPAKKLRQNILLQILIDIQNNNSLKLTL